MAAALSVTAASDHLRKCQSKKCESCAFNPSGYTERQPLSMASEPPRQVENLKIPTAIRLLESDMVIPGCVHSHEILEKTHPMFVSQACQAKLGVTKTCA